jgi:hypothetical protein
VTAQDTTDGMEIKQLPQATKVGLRAFFDRL